MDGLVFWVQFWLRKNGWKYRTKISQVEGFGKGTFFLGGCELHPFQDM